MFKGIAASLVVVGVFFFMNGCKNDVAASESTGETKSVVADTPAPDAPKASEKKEDAPKEPAPDKEDDTPEVASATKTDETPDAPASTGEEDEAATPETEEPAVPVASAATETTTGNTAGVELTATEGVQLADLTVARGIEAKKPLDPRNTYTLGEYERIVAFMSVLNPAETEDELHVSFLDTSNGRERGKVSVRVGAQKKWRTWAFTKTINKAGKWEILVRNKDGLVIGRAPFEILPAG